VESELPEEWRQVLFDILREHVTTSYLWDRIQHLLNPYGLDRIPQREGPIQLSEDERKVPDFEKVKRVLLELEWYRLYDIIEAAYDGLAFFDEQFAFESSELQAGAFYRAINEFFEHMGIAWQLDRSGRIVVRRDAAFESVVASATNALTSAKRPTASGHMDTALRALSQRPKADTSGAIYHAMGVLECVARDLTGNEKATLGEILKRHPDLLPRPLDSALSQMWGYASNEARHVAEGREPTQDDAALVVGIAAAMAKYLTRRSE
jgi:hypothetical protein